MPAPHSTGCSPADRASRRSRRTATRSIRLAEAAPLVALGGVVALRASRLDVRNFVVIRAAAASDAALAAGAALGLAGAGLRAASGRRRPGAPEVAPHGRARRRWPALGTVAALAAIPVVRGRPVRIAAPVDVRPGPELHLVTVNIERDSPGAGDAATAVAAADADVVLVQEHTVGTGAALVAAGLHDRYRWQVEAPEDGYFGAALLSRHRVVRSDVVVLGRRPMLTATLDVAGTLVEIVCVHTQAPIRSHDVAPWNEGFEDVTATVERARAIDRPSVLAGDWNATICSRPFRAALRRRGLVDAGEATRRWWPAPTWPADRRPLPPLLALDHVVVTPDVQVLGVRTLAVPGTDHRALDVRLRLRAAAPVEAPVEAPVKAAAPAAPGGP
ncbi:MAG: endonuclease/exonuclease/phosphatase family protein [Actinobacteria bacterium]|nr:endonuclease/exonuclease/phosphatase family protein [Actinomycetota bacterium]